MTRSGNIPGKFFCAAAAVVAFTTFASGAGAADKTVVIPLFSKSSAPKTEYLSIASEAFVPGSNVDYSNTYGCGGAFINTGGGALVAPVHLPNGAVVTDFKAFFNDTSASDMSVYLERQNLSSCGYTVMAQVDSSGASGYSSGSDASITNDTVDNTQYAYLAYAYSGSWDTNLKLKGVVVTYTTQ